MTSKCNAFCWLLFSSVLVGCSPNEKREPTAQTISWPDSIPWWKAK